MKTAIILLIVASVHLINCDYHPPPYAYTQYRPGFSSIGQNYSPELFGPNAIATNNSHHFQVGYPTYGNQLLYRQVHARSGSFWRKVERVVTFPAGI